MVQSSRFKEHGSGNMPVAPGTAREVFLVDITTDLIYRVLNVLYMFPLWGKSFSFVLLSFIIDRHTLSKYLNPEGVII